MLAADTELEAGLGAPPATRGARPAAASWLMIGKPHPEVRERLEAEEESRLSPFAARSRQAGGRLRQEPPDVMRPAYQRDRDRIIHSKALAS